MTTVENGVAIKSAATTDHPFTDGFLCAKVNHYLERTYRPDRLVHPHASRRQEGRGHVRAHLLGRGARRDRGAVQARSPHRRRAAGHPAVLATPARWACSVLRRMDRRFFHRLGASLLDRTICSIGGQGRASKVTLGGSVGMDPEAVRRRAAHPDLGREHRHLEPALWSFVQEAKRPGRAIVVIDPYRSRTAEKWHRAHPRSARHRRGARAGDDARIFPEGSRTATTSSATRSAARARASASREYPPERAAGIAGIAGRDDRELAREYAHDAAAGHPRELRPAAPRRRRHGRAHHRLPAGAGRAPGATRRRALLLDHGRRSTPSNTAASSGPT